MKLIAYGLETVAATRFEGQLEYLRTRRTIIEADEGLREREMRKLPVLSEAISRGFRNRGFDALTSILAAQLAVSVFNITISRWLDHDTLRALRLVTAEPAEQSHIA